MAKIRPLQASWSAGELSPRLYARTDAEGYSKSLKVCTNFRTTPHGMIERRNGTEMLEWDSNGSEGKYARLFPFNVNYSRAYAVLVTATKIRIFDRNGFKDNNALNADHEFDNDGVGWTTFAQAGGTVTFSTGLCRLFGNSSNSNAGIRQSFTVTAGQQHEISFRALNRYPVTIRLGTTSGGSQIHEGVYTSERFTIPFVPAGTTVWMEVELDGAGEKIIDYFKAYNIEAGIDFIEFNSPYTTLVSMQTLHVAYPPDVDAMYMTTKHVAPHRLTYNDGVWTFEEITFTTDADESLPWGDEYPNTCAFHQARFWMGGTDSKPAGLWGSKQTLYNNFELGDGQQDTDALDFTLSVKGEIQWLMGGKVLHVGTGLHEVSVTQQGAIITASDVQMIQQSSYGSAPVQPKAIATSHCFVSSSRRKVYAASYSDEQQGYVPVDMTFPSEHITKSGILTMAHINNPDNTLLCVLANGTIAGFTFEPSRQSAGWWRVNVDGKIVDACIVNELGIPSVYAVTLRIVDGQELLFYERYGAHYMDNHKTFEFAEPTDVVTGLEHLEGREVQVLVDGALIPNQTVTGGQITLPYAGTDVVVGLKFTAIAETLPFESPETTQSTQSLKKRYNKIYVRLFESGIPIINDDDKRYRNPSTPMNTGEGLKSGDVEVYNLGWDRIDNIKIEMELPYPCNVIGVFGELTMEGL